MPRKWTIFAVMMTATALTLAAGLSLADEDSAMHKLMEQVNRKSNAIKKTVRTAVAYKKGQADLAKHAEELIVLGKKARDMKDSADKQKKPFTEWQKLSDDFIKKTEEFKDVVAKSSATQEQAKKAWSGVNGTCAACHTEFRVEDEK
jgi:cytochrome c556